MGEGDAVRSGSLWHRLGSQLAHPRGRSGKIIGSLMGVANRRPTRLVINALDVGPNQSVLDIGCGPGHALALVAPLCREAQGVDRSDTMVEQAKRRNRRMIDQGRVVVGRGDFTDLPYCDERFDRIMASNVIYFWTDVGTVLTELNRVLRPDGRIVIYATARDTMQSWPFANTGTHRSFSLSEFSQALHAPNTGLIAKVEQVVLPGQVHGLIGILHKRDTL